MSNEEILAGNQLLAEFMGGVLDSPQSKYYYFPEKGRYETELKYHSSWDWLMSVVEKIESLGFDVKIKGIACSINRLCEDETIIQFVLGDRARKIELVWSVVLDFIKWYNEQPK